MRARLGRGCRAGAGFSAAGSAQRYALALCAFTVPDRVRADGVAAELAVAMGAAGGAHAAAVRPGVKPLGTLLGRSPGRLLRAGAGDPRNAGGPDLAQCPEPGAIRLRLSPASPGSPASPVPGSVTL